MAATEIAWQHPIIMSMAATIEMAFTRELATDKPAGRNRNRSGAAVAALYHIDRAMLNISRLQARCRGLCAYVIGSYMSRRAHVIMAVAGP